MCYEVIPEYNEMDSFHFTICEAIPITDDSGEKVLLELFYHHLKHIMEAHVKGVDSSKGKVKTIHIRLYTTEMPNITNKIIAEKSRYLNAILSNLPREQHDTPPPKPPASSKENNLS